MPVGNGRNDVEPLPLAAVIVNWNGGEHVVRCIESLLESRPALAEILVVDNASSDGSLQRVAGLDGVTVLETGSNLGFAGGANAGARATTAPIILFLNPDVRFHPDAPAALARAFGDPRVGVAGPELRNPDGTLQNRGIVIDPTGHPVGAENDAVFFVSGCSLAVRRELFEALGGFDDDYFMFAEDLDLCWRAQLAGRRVAAVPDAVAFHDGGASISGGYLDHGPLRTNVTRLYLRERNTLAAVLTNYGRGRALSVAALRALMALGEALVFAIRGRPDASRAYFRALGWVACHAPALAAKRRRVQGSRIVSDRELVGVIPRLVKLDVARTAGIPSLDAPVPSRDGR
jgi:hypothetical protein